MQFDLGIQGLGLLVLMSGAFGVITHLVLAKTTTRWVGLIGAVAYFLGGLVASEVVFGSATEKELQPNIDGLSFDEAVLFGLLVAVTAVLVTRYVTRHGRLGRPAA